jgi:RNA polymerase sporulation-specific sigma factor
MDDLISIGTIGLMKAANTFRTDKNIKLATYASRCIENEILMYIRKSVNSRTELSIDEPLSTDYDGNELLLSDVLGTDEDSATRNLEETEEKRVIYEAVATLPAREREIIELRFGLIDGHEMTQKDVADAMGISQSYISRLEKRILLELREKIRDKI